MCPSHQRHPQRRPKRVRRCQPGESGGGYSNDQKATRGVRGYSNGTQTKRQQAWCAGETRNNGLPKPPPPSRRTTRFDSAGPLEGSIIGKSWITIRNELEACSLPLTTEKKEVRKNRVSGGQLQAQTRHERAEENWKRMSRDAISNSYRCAIAVAGGDGHVKLARLGGGEKKGGAVKRRPPCRKVVAIPLRRRQRQHIPVLINKRLPREAKRVWGAGREKRDARLPMFAPIQPQDSKPRSPSSGARLWVRK